MPTNLDNILADDMARVFASPDMTPGAEQVTYHPFNGVARAVYAQVFRLGLQDRNGVTREVVELHFPNSATLGVLSSTVNFGKDEATVAPVRGGTTKRMLLHMPGDGLEFSDAGSVRVEAW